MELQLIIQSFAKRLIEKNWKFSAAESCTGGLVSKSCTDISGSSAWFDRGFITYSNSAKTDLLNVEGALITKYGAVSKEVAEAMVNGAIENSQSQIAVALTGIAGPEGGSIEKPVGTVWIAWSVNQLKISECFVFSGNRSEIRSKATHKALEKLLDLIN